MPIPSDDEAMAPPTKMTRSRPKQRDAGLAIIAAGENNNNNGIDAANFPNRVIQMNTNTHARVI